MKPFRLALLAVACTASAALAQTTGSSGGVTPAPAPATPTQPGVITPAPGTTTTNPALGGTLPGAAGSGSSVAAQAQQRRQLALQQCQILSGSSRSDCVKAADDDFTRATGSDSLALQGQGSAPGSVVPAPQAAAPAGNTRSTPDVSPTQRDSTMR